MAEKRSLDEEERLRRRKKKRKAAKKKAVIRRLKILLASLVIILIGGILLALALGGAFFKKSDESTLTIQKNGKVVFEEITTLNEDYYDAAEMKEFVNKAISEFNESSESGKIKMKRFEVHKDTVYLRTEYDSAKTYSDFTGYTVLTGTVKDLKKEGVTFDEVYAIVKEGKKDGNATAADAIKDTGKNAVCIMENVCVKVPGSVDFVSDPCTEIKDYDTVKITQSSEDSDAVVTTYIIYE